jgi:selenocysteine-specific elongation factor
MAINNYTIGMAGHIDHGKTTLTKALSGIDTDTLKEEKARKITIEPGFAPFPLTDEIHTSIVDVPGHEKLIRQMIAGVAGIDLVLFVIAADEGVMPQTREHFEILSFLGIQNGIIVVTKSDLIDDEMKLLVEEDIEELTENSFFESFPVHFVDSLSMSGINHLKEAIAKKLSHLKARSSHGPFRMPIDHIFIVKGQGTVVRGTVFEGEVREGNELIVEPGNTKVRVRKIQVHKEDAESASAGQRAAVNLSGGSKEDWKRGHVLISPNAFTVTETVDLVLTTGKDWAGKLKQRSFVKFYTGTSEVMGKVIFFDRNELESSTDQVFCQVRLSEPVVTKRGDRFIIRRPSPEKTIGGGEVIDPNGTSYRFGQDTIKMLKEKLEGTPEERIEQTLVREGALHFDVLQRLTGIDEIRLKDLIGKMRDSGIVQMLNGFYVAEELMEQLKEETVLRLKNFHDSHSLRQGIPKAELVQGLKNILPNKVITNFIDYLSGHGFIELTGQFVHLPAFNPVLPAKWEKRMQQVITKIEDMGLEPEDLQTIYKSQQLPEDLYNDFKFYLIKNGFAYMLFDEVLISKSVLLNAVEALKKETNESFTVQEAKTVLNLSRKFLIPILECMDSNGYTLRDTNVRKWV